MIQYHQVQLQILGKAVALHPACGRISESRIDEVENLRRHLARRPKHLIQLQRSFEHVGLLEESYFQRFVTERPSHHHQIE